MFGTGNPIWNTRPGKSGIEVAGVRQTAIKECSAFFGHNANVGCAAPYWLHSRYCDFKVPSGNTGAITGIPSGTVFSVSVCSDDTERRKPFPEPLLKYLELSGAKSTEVLYIGDSEHDMACAKAAGVDCGLAMWGRSYAKKNPSADFYFVSPEEITNLICE